MTTLKHQVVHGLKWSLFAKMITQIFSWVSTFMVIRMLTPGDYGVMALAMVFFSFITVVSNAGLISALVVQQRMRVRAASQIFTLSLLINVTLSMLLAIAAPSIAQWYSNPELCHVLWALCIVNPLLSFTVVPQAELQIDMRFKAKSVIDSVAGLVSACVALSAAYSGHAYWSLVYASIATILIRVVGLSWLTQTKARLTYRWKGARELFSYAWNAQLGAIIWFAYDKADAVILARTLGVGPAGVYNVANEVSSIPMTKISGIMNEVAFSAFAKTKHDPQAAAGYLKKALRLMSALAFPVLYGLAAIAEQAVPLLLGAQWAEAGLIVLCLSLALPFRMFTTVLVNYSGGMGAARFGRQNLLITATILISAIFIGAQYGIVQTAIAWSIGYAFTFAILLYRYHANFQLPWSTLLNFAPVWSASAVMCGALLAVTPWLTVSLDGSLLLVVLAKIVLGGLLMGALLWRWHGEELVGLFRR